MKTESTANAACEKFETFQNCWEAPVVESLFNKQKFLNPTTLSRNLSRRLLFQKAVLLEIPRNSLLSRVAGFSKVFWKFWKTPRKSCYGVSLEQIASHPITASSLTLHVFEIMENSWDNVCCGVPLTEAVPNRFSTE